jgi:putative nucleotidyltransferase with HDIG domain
VRPAAWFLNVIPRTLRAFLPVLARPDDAFARRVLSSREYRLYAAMDARDRHHGVVVAKGVLRRAPDAEAALVRAALLHDVGKSDAPYRPWERIAVHVVAPAGPPPWLAHEGLRRAWNRHRDHARRGADMIRAAGGDPVVADLVARHHDGDARVALIAAADEAT